MMAMVEMSDGRVLNVMHEGYRVPSVMRAQYFRVTPDGPVAAESKAPRRRSRPRMKT